MAVFQSIEYIELLVAIYIVIRITYEQYLEKIFNYYFNE